METSASLLDSLRVASNQEAWSRMVELYAPLIRGWLKRQGAASNDVDDIVQEVLTVVLKKIAVFEKQPHTGAFRSWLRSITVNCIRDQWKKQNRQPTAGGGSSFLSTIQQLEDPHSQISQMWNREHDEHVTRYLLNQIRGSFKEQTWRAFERFAIDGLSAGEVANELNMSENAVFIAKSRIMSELRRQGIGLID